MNALRFHNQIVNSSVGLRELLLFKLEPVRRSRPASSRLNELNAGYKVTRMPSRVEDYDVLYTIGSGSYGKCQKVRRKSDGKVSTVFGLRHWNPSRHSARRCTFTVVFSERSAFNSRVHQLDQKVNAVSYQNKGLWVVRKPEKVAG